MADSQLILELLFLHESWLFSYDITFVPNACGDMLFYSIC